MYTCKNPFLSQEVSICSSRGWLLAADEGVLALRRGIQMVDYPQSENCFYQFIYINKVFSFYHDLSILVSCLSHYTLKGGAGVATKGPRKSIVLIQV